MKRQPCGTRAAYMRHWRNGEEACGPCKDAAAGGPPKRPRQSKTSNVETRKYDEVIAANEPKILWRKNRRGVFVAVVIDDPHTDHKFRDKGDAA